MKNQFKWFRKKDCLYLSVFLFLSFLGINTFERSLVWLPTREIREYPSDKGIAFEEVFFQTEDGVRLNGWYFPPKEPAKASILFCHGNGGNLSTQYARVQLLGPLGVNFFIFDYRGYGKSEGILTESGTYLDAQAAYEWLREKTPDLPIIVHGWSLGAAIATHLATRVKTAALISENGFCSIPAVGKDRYSYLPTNLLSWNRYNAQSRISKVNCPVLIVHSREDTTVFYHHGEQLFAAAKEPKLMKTIPGGHDCAFVSPEEYTQTIADFLDRFVLAPADNKKGT